MRRNALTPGHQTASAGPSTRTREPKALRREQLIAATIDSIAKRGYAATTVAEICDGAGLSRGSVNFHFKSKDKLFLETLQFMADEYSGHWQMAVAGAGPDAASRMRALVDADFDRRICNRRKISAWFAFMAEAKTNAAYRRLCWTRDDAFRDAIRTFCAAMKAEAGYVYDPQSTATAIYALQEGLWLRLMLSSGDFSRQSARQAALRTIGTLFPAHFTADGEVKPSNGRQRL